MTLEHDAVREKLIAQTLELLGQGGLDAVKARSLAQAVGVSVGTIYNLFGSVDGLVAVANQQIYAELRTLGESGLARIEADIAGRIASAQLDDTPRTQTRERLLGLAGIYIDFVAANAMRWNAVIAFNRRTGTAVPDGYAEQLETLVDIVGQLLTPAPRFADPAERHLAGRALWSAVHGIVTTNYLGQDPEHARTRTWRLIEILVGAFIDGAFIADGN